MIICRNCGYRSEDNTVRFCPRCNTAMSGGNARRPDHSSCVQRMQAGDPAAFGEFYEATYKDMYYLALKLMKNASEAEDVLQEAYIKAWRNIGMLRDPSALRGWISCIVANTAKNALVRKQPTLFSELSSENDDGEVLPFDVADSSSASQPELRYSEKETQELVREMIDSLSDEQRFCILMFHLEGLSIKEIAAVLGVSENTVKSRLNYGRKNLEKKAEELRKKGYQLYSILPLLPLLMRREASSPSFSNAAYASFSAGKARLLPQQTAGYTYAPAADTAAGYTYAPASNMAAGYAYAPAADTVKSGFLLTVGSKIAIGAAVVAMSAAVAFGAIAAHVLISRTPDADLSSSSAVTVQAAVTDTPDPGTGGAAAAGTAAQSQATPTPTAAPTATPAPAQTEVTSDQFSSLICGNLTEDELETVLAYGPEEGQTGLTDSEAQGYLNIFIQAIDLVTGEKCISTGQHAYMTTVNMAEMNRYFSSFDSYEFTPENIDVIERGAYIAYTPAQINFEAHADITEAYIEDDVLYIGYDYLYHKDEDPGFREEENIDTHRVAVFTQQSDGLYRLLRTEES